MRSRFLTQPARLLRLFSLIAALPFANVANADENGNASSARTDVEAKGLEFVRNHPSEWQYKVTMDELTSKPVAEANSTQSNDAGVSGSVRGKCEDDGTITFSVVVSADKGQSPEIVHIQDGSARVRFRLNDSLGVRLANWDQIWGVLISFETSQGDLVVSIPIRHNEIQRLFALCFGRR
jgi:hypothetical protein